MKISGPICRPSMVTETTDDENYFSELYIRVFQEISKQL